MDRTDAVVTSQQNTRPFCGWLKEQRPNNIYCSNEKMPVFRPRSKSSKITTFDGRKRGRNEDVREDRGNPGSQGSENLWGWAWRNAAERWKTDVYGEP